MIGDFDPSLYTDVYTDRLKDLIASKTEGGQFVSPSTATEKMPEIGDLLARLEASIAAKKEAA